jgi:acetate kinase
VSTPERLDVLVMNCGSSSLKFGLFKVGASSIETLVSGEAASIGNTASTFEAKDVKTGRQTSETDRIIDQKAAVARVLQCLKDWDAPPPAAVGHRIVHGGPKLRRHCLIDNSVLKALDAAAPFAPLHTPEALTIIAATRDLFQNIPQVACFDTTFHAQMPDVARVLPIPHALKARGIYRYGFHGLSCESILHQLAEDVPKRLIIAHLGAGASITAVKAGISIDTSMGLTPTGGVMMGARSGDIDPGVLLYLVREKHFNAARLEELVDRRSGLLGVSGVSGDMRALRAAAPSNPDARLAIDMFAYGVRKQIAAMAAVLEGVDMLVFTGGIGENDRQTRQSIRGGLSWLGIGLDDTEQGPSDGQPASGCFIKVIPSQEDEQIARHTRMLMPSSSRQ